MKRYFKTISAAMLSILAVAACQKENLGSAQDGQEVDVNLTLTSPEIGTKSYGDGQTVNTVHVWVYQVAADGTMTYIAPAASGETATPTQEVKMNGGTAKYSTRLVTGQKYTFVFWADYQKDGYNSPYSYDSGLKTINVSYTGAAGNDEKRDAFYNVLKDVEITGAYSTDVKLYRPFAQINFGASDLAAAKSGGLDVQKAAVKLTKAATSLNLLTGDVEGEADVTFGDAALAGGKLTVGGVDYDYLTMDYVLVGKDAKTLSDVTLSANSGAWTYTYSNVPLQGNYRTNIVGNLFTNPAAVNITVAPGFEDPDNNVYPELLAVAANGGSITLSDDVELSEPLVIAAGKDVVINLNGKNIRNASTGVAIKADGNLTIEGDGNVYGGKGGNNQTIHAAAGSKVIINGGNFSVGTDASGYGNSCVETSGGDIVINGGRFETEVAWRGWYYVLNQNNSNPGTIIVNGGEFVNYDPSKGDDNLGGNFVAEGYASVVASASPLTYKVVKATKAETEDAIENSLNVAGTGTIVSKDVSVATISVKKKSTLKLANDAVVSGNGGPEGKHNDAIQVGSGANLTIEGKGSIKACTISSSQTPAINVIGGGVVNIYDGITVDGGSGSNGNYAIKLVAGTANIYGGYFCSGVNADGSSSEVIYLYSVAGWKRYAKTTLNIYGGVFESLGDPEYLINCYDDSFKKGYCSVKVMGGIFVGFNPADNSADGEHTNYVAPGYKSEETTYNGKQAWEVVPE